MNQDSLDLTYFKHRLLQLLALIREAEFTGVGISKFFFDEQSWPNLEEEDVNLSLKVKGRERHLHFKIRKALQRIENGTFGLCYECGENIEINRLLARPIAELCLACKEEEEKKECHIPYQKKSHTLGKILELKNHV